MNPVEIENDIRALDVMLHGRGPVRPVADFGRDEVGRFEAGKSRAPGLRHSGKAKGANPRSLSSDFVITEDGKMRVEGPEPA